MSEYNWRQAEDRYTRAEEIGVHYEWDFDDFEAEQDGSLDTWVRLIDAAETVAALEADRERLEAIRNLANDLTSGKGWTVERDQLVPPEQRGAIAQSYWNDSLFSYGMEYGVLAAAGLLAEEAQPID